MPKFYAVAYDNGTNKIFSSWTETEKAIKGRGDVRFKKFNDQQSADVWGHALAEWLKKRKSTLEVLRLEEDFSRLVEKSDPRLVPLP